MPVLLIETISIRLTSTETITQANGPKIKPAITITASFGS